MKTVNVFYLTKEFFENELNIKNVIEFDKPITILNNQPKVAKMFKWDNLESLQKKIL